MLTKLFSHPPIIFSLCLLLYYSTSFSSINNIFLICSGFGCLLLMTYIVSVFCLLSMSFSWMFMTSSMLLFLVVLVTLIDVANIGFWWFDIVFSHNISCFLYVKEAFEISHSSWLLKFACGWDILLVNNISKHVLVRSFCRKK